MKKVKNLKLMKKWREAEKKEKLAISVMAEEEIKKKMNDNIRKAEYGEESVYNNEM